MALQKNPGPPLTSKFRGLLDVIPQKWRSKLGLTRIVQQQPVDVEPTPIGDTTSEGVRISSTVEQERTDERKKTDVFLTDVLGSVMVEYIRTPDGQIATRTYTVVAEGTALPTIDELTADASQDAWGNGMVEQVVTTVPNLFGKNDYRVERPDRVPPDFGVLLKTTETGVTVAGTATMPVLGVGELMRSEQQLTEQTKRVTVRSRDLASLPITLTGYDTDQDKEIVTIVRTWQLATVPPIVPSATTDTKYDPLGDGTAVQTVASKNVFDHPVYSVERADRVPEDFGALLQVTETSITSVGAITSPVLGTGELMRREEQISEFTKRITIRARDVAALPKTLVNKETSPDKQVVTVTRTWGVDTMTVPLPTATDDVKFTRLGDGTAILEVLGIPNVFGGRDYTRERPDNTPSDFGALLQLETFSETVAGTAADPTLGVGELFREEKQVTEFTKRVTVKSRDLASLPITLVDKRTNQDKQVVTVTKVWDVDTVAPGVPSALQDVEFKRLGDGTAITETLGVPNVFGGRDYMRERPDNVPPEFAILLEKQTFIEIVAGIAADPTLGTGEYRREEQQITEFTKRVTVVKRDPATFPRTIVSKRTNENKQVVTVTRTWDLDTVTPPVPTALQDATFQPLGDGTAIIETLGVSNVFGGRDYTRERPDNVPPEFAILLEKQTFEETVTGIAADPTLGVGEYRREERQVTEFTKRISVVKRDPATFPRTLVSKKTNQDKQVVTVTRTWDLDTVTPPVPTALQDSSFTPLGDGTAIIEVLGVPNVFGGRDYTRQKPDNVPPEFGALLITQEFSEEISGTAVDPTLGTGELFREEKQVTEFTKRVTVRSRDVASLPKTFIDKDTDENDQVVTVTKTWDVETVAPPAPTATTDVKFTRLGDGTAITVVRGVPNVFGGFDYSRERRDNVPAEFGALLETTVFTQDIAGIAADPVLDVGELAREEKQLTNFIKRVTVKARDVAALPKTIVDKDTDENKQVVTVTKTWQLDTVVPPAPTSLTKVKLDKLGDGTAIQTVLGVPNVFGGNDYSRERRDLVPPEFGALLEITVFSQDVAGTAADPTLGTGELAREEKQIDNFVKRVTVRARDLASLPQTLVSYETDQNKEMVTVTRTWELDTVAPVAPTATKDTVFAKLGDGTAIQTVKEKTVFAGQTYGKSLENLIPPKFRAFIPTRTHEFVATGVVVPDPAFAAGEISHEEQQIDEFNKRVKSVTIAAPSLPVVGHDYETGEEFGGGVLNITYTLDTTAAIGSAVDTGLDVIESKITDLGNGYSIKETKQKATLPWPLLQGQDYDDRLDVVLPFTQQVVAAGTSVGAARTEIKPLDVWRQQNRVIDITEVQAVLNSYSLLYPSKVNLDMPDKLVSVEGIMETSSGEGTQDETGTVAFTGGYSISMALRASAQSSATILPDAIAIIKQFWGNGIASSNIQFFLPSPVTPADVLTRLTTILGASVSAWPKFNPVMVTLKAVGQRQSLQTVATSQGSASASGSGSSSTTAGGTGHSREVGLSLKTIRISPTIHAALSLIGTTTGSQSISASASAEATGLGPFETITQSASVSGNISPTSIPATVGATDWPTMGKFLYRVDAQPYRFGFIQFHCVVVDAVDFPSN